MALVIRYFLPTLTFAYGFILMIGLYAAICIVRCVCEFLEIESRKTVIAYVKKQATSIICLAMCICAFVSFSSIRISEEIDDTMYTYNNVYRQQYIEDNAEEIFKDIKDNNTNDEAIMNKITWGMRKEANYFYLIVDILSVVLQILSFSLIINLMTRIQNTNRINLKGERIGNNFRALSIAILVISLCPILITVDNKDDQSESFKDGKLEIMFDELEDESSRDYANYEYYKETVDKLEEAIENYSDSDSTEHSKTVLKSELQRYKDKVKTLEISQNGRFRTTIIASIIMVVFEFLVMPFHESYRKAVEADEIKKKEDEVKDESAEEQPVAE